jgi:intergrase/recombinase
LLLLSLLVSCSSKEEPAKPVSLTVTGRDVALFLQNKKAIDLITEEYDKKISEAPAELKSALVEQGKQAINNYLTLHGIEPVSYMKKSKKIMKCYIAFANTSELMLEKRADELRRITSSEAEYERQVELLKNASDKLFKDYTADLTEAEIDVIRPYFKQIAAVIQ